MSLIPLIRTDYFQLLSMLMCLHTLPEQSERVGNGVKVYECS